MSFARAVLSRQHLFTGPFLKRDISSAQPLVKTRQNNRQHYEGFSSLFWRKTLVASLIIVGVYKYAPEATEDVYLTRWIALYCAPRERWLDIAAKHTAMSVDGSEVNLLVTNAKKTAIHRYRYKQMFDQASPFLTPVGGNVDTSDFVMKGRKD